MAGSNQKAGWAQRMKSFQTKQVDINRIIMKYLITVYEILCYKYELLNDDGTAYEPLNEDGNIEPLDDDRSYELLYYLGLKPGYMDAAQKFEAAAKLETVGQLDTHEHRMRVKNAVRAGQLQYAMDLAKRLYPKLYESDNYMYFHMQQLRLIELIRERKHINGAAASGNGSTYLTTDPFQMEEPQSSCRQQQQQQQLSRDEFDCMAMIESEQAACMEPKMMFLVKLILWAQGKLDKDGIGCGLDLECEDFELELKRALQKNNNN